MFHQSGHEVLGIIQARGGSKSIPRKNIQPFLGKPLIAWTIEEGKKACSLNRLIVSTDDEEIAAVARQYGAEAPFLRPAELAADSSPSLDALLHALDWLEKNERYVPDAVALLPPTAPLRRAEYIDAGVELLLRSPEADSVRPVIEAPKHPYKTLALEGEYLKPFFSEDVTGFSEPYDLPRQILPKAYIYSGALQVMWTRTLRELKSLTGRKSKYFLMKPEDSVNIDGPIDFKLAEVLMAERLP